MPKVSRRQLKKETKMAIRKDLWKSLDKTENAEETEFLLSHILSPTEVIMISKRLAILKELLVGRPYSEIAERLKVTEGTIAKMSANLQKGGNRFLQLLARLSK